MCINCLAETKLSMKIITTVTIPYVFSLFLHTYTFDNLYRMNCWILKHKNHTGISLRKCNNSK